MHDMLMNLKKICRRLTKKKEILIWGQVLRNFHFCGLFLFVTSTTKEQMSFCVPYLRTGSLSTEVCQLLRSIRMISISQIALSWQSTVEGFILWTIPSNKYKRNHNKHDANFQLCLVFTSFNIF